MDVLFYRMKSGQEGLVAAFIQQLTEEYGAKFPTFLTPEILRENAGFLNIEVAEAGGELVGFCAWVLNFSTWRGIKGIYIADLYVRHMDNHRMVAGNLLRAAAQNGQAQGAQFMRTEVDITDEAHSQVYTDAGFWSQKRHVMHFLEPDKFKLLAG